jgi:hypothetical protein
MISLRRKICGGFFDTHKEVALCLGNLKDLVRIRVARSLLRSGFVSFTQSRNKNGMTSMIEILRAINATDAGGER